MPKNNFTAQESGTDNSDHAGVGGSGLRDSVEGRTTPSSNPDGPPEANRHRLPDERAAVTHHFSIGGNEGYLNGRSLSEWPAGRSLHPHGEGGIDDLRTDGILRGSDFRCSAAWSASQCALQQAVSYSLRTLGLDRKCGAWLREIGHGLYLSLDGIALSLREAAGVAFLCGE